MGMQRINLRNVLDVVSGKIVTRMLALGFALLLTGCASIPLAIQTTTEPQQNLPQIMTAPQHYVGQQVRFGGKVVGVENQPDSTRLEIAVMPLNNVARPVLSEITVGRIYANVQGFLDPVDFQGSLITVLGTVAGTKPGKIGHKDYKFLLVNVSGYQRWQVIQVMRPQYIDPWFGAPYWGYGYGTWGWRSPYPIQMESIIVEK